MGSTEFLERAERHLQRIRQEQPLLSPQEAFLARAARHRNRRVKELTAGVEPSAQFTETFKPRAALRAPAPDFARQSTLATPATQPPPPGADKVQPRPEGPNTPPLGSYILGKAYNSSLQKLANDLIEGKDTGYNLSGYDPSVIEDIAGEVLSFVMPLDVAALAVPGGAVGKIGTKIAPKLTSKLVQLGVKEAVAKGAVETALAGAKSSAALGTYGAARPALEGRYEDIPEEGLRSGALGLILGVTGRVAAPLGQLGRNPATGAIENLPAAVGGQAGKLASEIGAFSGGAAALEGRMPTVEDLEHATGLVLGLKLQGAVLGRAGGAIKRRVGEWIFGKSQAEGRPADEVAKEMAEKPEAWQEFTQSLEPELQKEIDKVRAGQYEPGGTVKLTPEQGPGDVTPEPLDAIRQMTRGELVIEANRLQEMNPEIGKRITPSKLVRMTLNELQHLVSGGRIEKTGEKEGPSPELAVETEQRIEQIQTAIKTQQATLEKAKARGAKTGELQPVQAAEQGLKDLKSELKDARSQLAALRAADKEATGATTERKVTDGNQPEHQRVEALGVSAEAGGGNRPGQGGEVVPEAGREGKAEAPVSRKKTAPTGGVHVEPANAGTGPTGTGRSREPAAPVEAEKKIRPKAEPVNPNLAELAKEREEAFANIDGDPMLAWDAGVASDLWRDWSKLDRKERKTRLTEEYDRALEEIEEEIASQQVVDAKYAAEAEAAEALAQKYSSLAESVSQEFERAGWKLIRRKESNGYGSDYLTFEGGPYDERLEVRLSDHDQPHYGGYRGYQPGLSDVMEGKTLDPHYGASDVLIDSEMTPEQVRALVREQIVAVTRETAPEAPEKPVGEAVAPGLWTPTREPKAPQAQAGAASRAPAKPSATPAEHRLVTHFGEAIKSGKNLESPPAILARAREVEPKLTMDEDYPNVRDQYDLKINLDAKANPKELPKPLRPKGGKPMAIPDIIRYAEEAFYVPIRFGKFRAPKGAVGVYKREAGVARLKQAGDLPTLSHEVAHHIDHTLDVKTLYEGSTEIKSLDYAVQAGEIAPEKGRPTEGFAEYIRLWLTHEADPAVMAPEFHRKFRGFLKANPAVEAKLDNLRRMIQVYQQQGTDARVAAALTSEPPKKQKGIARWIHEIQTAVFDSFTPLRLVDREVERRIGRRLRGEESAFQLATALRNKAQSKARQWLEVGAADFDGNIVGKSLKAITEPVAEKLEEAVQYTYAKHAVERWKQGKNPGISLADAEHFLETHKSAEFETFAKEMSEYRRHLLDYVVKAGGLSQETADLWKRLYEYSIPLYRTGFDGPGGAGGGRGFAGLPKPIKRAKGSGRQVVNPLAGLLQETERLISWADRARVGQTLIEEVTKAEGLGSLVEKVNVGARATSVKLQDVLDKLEKAGFEITGEAKDLDQMMTFFTYQAHGIPRDNVVAFWKDGKLEAYQLDKDLYDAVAWVDKQYLQPWLRWVSLPKRAVVAGATGYRASFGLVTNPMRDVFTYLVQSKRWNWPWKPFFGDAQAIMAKAGLGTPNAQVRQFFQQGGELATVFNSEIPQAMKTAREFMSDAKWEGKTSRNMGKVAGKTVVVFKHPIDLYRTIINLPELGPRLVEYQQTYEEVLQETGSQRSAWIEAMNAAQDVTINFSRSGYVTHYVNQFLPFFNPAVQDASVFVRTLRARPFLTTAKAAGWITIPTLGLWAWNKDKDWYRALPMWRKIAFWHHDFGGDTIFAYPKPFSWAWAFAAVPEGLIDAHYRKDPSIAKDQFFQGLEKQSPVSDWGDLVPAGLRPTLEVAMSETGNDWFRDRPIDSHWEVEKLPPELRYGRYTTESAKYIGKLIGYSPDKIDHWISGTTGGGASDIIKGIESFFVPKVGTRSAADWPFIGRLVARPPFLGHLYDEVNRLRDERKRLEFKEPPKWTEDEQWQMLVLDRYEAFGKEISDIRKAITGFLQDKEMPFDEKQARVEELEKLAEQLAREAVFGWDSELERKQHFQQTAD